MAWEFSLISPIYNAVKDTLSLIARRKKKLEPADAVKLRQKWKEEIESRLRWIDDTVGYGEAIIRDVKRVDSYPDTDDKNKGISPWFRVGLLGTYHKGLQVGLNIEGLVYDESELGWRYNNHKQNEKADLNAYLVGLIPFERIVSIDWDGDKYYYIPHIYCEFSGKRKEPYEGIVFCEKRQLDQHVYYSEIAKYEDVVKLSKKLKTGYFA